MKTRLLLVGVATLALTTTGTALAQGKGKGPGAGVRAGGSVSAPLGGVGRSASSMRRDMTDVTRSTMGTVQRETSRAGRRATDRASVTGATNANVNAGLEGSGSMQSKRQGPDRANERAVERANANAELQGAASMPSKRQGPERATERAVERANANAQLTGGAATTIDLANPINIPAGTELTDQQGRILGRIERVITSPTGNVNSVVVRVRNGARQFLRTVPADSLSLNGNVLVTSMTRGQWDAR